MEERNLSLQLVETKLRQSTNFFFDFSTNFSFIYKLFSNLLQSIWNVYFLFILILISFFLIHFWILIIFFCLIYLYLFLFILIIFLLVLMTCFFFKLKTINYLLLSKNMINFSFLSLFLMSIFFYLCYFFFFFLCFSSFIWFFFKYFVWFNSYI